MKLTYCFINPLVLSFMRLNFMGVPDWPGYIGEGWSVITTKGWSVRRALEGVAVAEKG
jgi:hypothetical protein